MLGFILVCIVSWHRALAYLEDFDTLNFFFYVLRAVNRKLKFYPVE